MYNNFGKYGKTLKNYYGTKTPKQQQYQENDAKLAAMFVGNDFDRFWSNLVVDQAQSA